jgi:hypothetical protein
MTTTDMTYDELTSRLDHLSNSGLLKLTDTVKLAIGQGKATKTLIGMKVELDGTVVLVASGNEHAAKATPATKKAAA